MATSSLDKPIALQTSHVAHVHTEARARVAARALVAVLLAVGLLDTVRTGWQGWQLANSPFPTCMTEVYTLEGIQAVARGEALYPPMGELPWVFRIYHPLTYLPAGLAARWCDWDLDRLWLASRVVPLASVVGILAIVAYYLLRRTQNAWIAALGVALVVHFHSSTLTDFFRNRPETPALLLSLAGWMLAQLRPRGWPVASALACAGALAFKQSFLAAPLAIALQLVVERHRGPFIAFAATGIAASAALVGGCWMFLGDGYWQHTVQAMGADPIHPLDAAKLFYPVLIQHHWGLLLAAFTMALAWFARQGQAERPLLIYLATSFLWTSITHGKVGADLNYHGELSLLMVLAVSVATGQMLARQPKMALASLLIFAAATLLPIARHGLFWNDVCTHRLLPQPGGFSLAPPLGDVRSYVPRYRHRADRALILDHELALRTGHVAVMDWLTARLLIDAGYLDGNKLAGSLAQNRYDVLVLKRDINDAWLTRLEQAAREAGFRTTFADARILELSREGQAESVIDSPQK